MRLNVLARDRGLDVAMRFTGGDVDVVRKLRTHKATLIPIPYHSKITCRPCSSLISVS